MSGWKKTADIAVIGGGIVGICTSYFLAFSGRKNIVLLEKNLLAQASTGLCVGGIRQQFSHPSNILLSQETLRRLKEISDGFRVDLGFRRVGYLFLSQEETSWKDFKLSCQTQRRLGVPVEILMPEEIKRRWSYIETDDLKGGTFCPEDGFADPYSVSMAFAKGARKLGVRIHEETEVQGIRLKNGKMSGLETTRGFLSVPAVVNAAGPWARQVGQMVGIELPVFPYRRQVFMTASFDALPRPVPMILDADSLFYFRGEGPGLLLGMSDPHEPSSFHTHTDRSFMEKVGLTAVRRAPVLEKARIQRGWAGLYSITPDENPIIGGLPGVEGFYAAVGFSGHGFQHGPSVGRILSELILDGKTSFDLFPFRLDRFSHPHEPGEKRVI